MNDFDWASSPVPGPSSAEGMVLSALLVAVATAGGLVFGFGLALMRRSRHRPRRRACDGLRHGDAIRALDPGPVSGSTSWSRSSSAGRSDRWRGADRLRPLRGGVLLRDHPAGMSSVRAGQVEAALATGMRPWQVMRLIIMPQACGR
jgi:glutamate/aspartate transport system permease protein